MFFDLTTSIIDKEPPQLDRQKFGREFCDFVDDWWVDHMMTTNNKRGQNIWDKKLNESCFAFKSLMKEESRRPSLRDLMYHPFIQQNQNEKSMDKIMTIMVFVCDVIKKENDKNAKERWRTTKGHMNSESNGGLFSRELAT